MDNELRGNPIDVPHSRHLDSSQYDHLEITLSSYGEDIEHLLPKFKEHGMTYLTLTSLEDEDLQLLGVSDPDVRHSMLTSFGRRNRKVHTYDRMLNGIDKGTYNKDVLIGIGCHLENMSNVLRLAKLKLDIAAPRVVVNASDCVSATLKTLDHMEVNLDEMEMILEEMTPDLGEDKKFPIGILLATSLIGICLSALITLKLA